MGWSDPAHPGGPGPAAFHVRDVDREVEMMPGPPPSYSEHQPWPPRQETMEYAPTPRAEPWWKPKYWRKKTWAIVAPIVIVILIIIIVVPVKVAEANRYPDYTRLDYSLSDECKPQIIPSIIRLGYEVRGYERKKKHLKTNNFP